MIRLKKTHTKAFANLIASILLLCIEGWALFQTYGFKVVKKATVQPAAFPPASEETMYSP